MNDKAAVIDGLKSLSDEISKIKDLWAEPTIQAIYDAIELLKDQEPHLLTFMQAKGIVNGVAWVELKDRQQVDPWIVLHGKIWRPDYNTGYECWDICKEDEYNRIVRCWISKPTDEQRQEAKWND